MSYLDAAWERAMTVQEVLLKALSGELQHGYVGLVDKRLHRPSARRVGYERRR